MKLTKTIAAIAAVALTVSAMSFAAFAGEGEECAHENTEAIETAV